MIDEEIRRQTEKTIEQKSEKELAYLQGLETKKYVKIGITAFITVVCCILFFFIILRFDGFTDVWGKIFTAAQPIIIGLVLAYMLNPVMRFCEGIILKFLHRRKVKEKKAKKMARSLGVASSVIFLFLILGLLIAAIVPATISSIASLTETLPTYVDNFTDKLDDVLKNTNLAHTIESAMDYITNWFQNYVEHTLKPQAQVYVAQITSGVISIVKVIANFLIGIFVAVYVMMIQETLTGQSKKILYTIFKPKRANIIIKTVRKSSDIFGGFITGKILDSAIIGVIAYIGCCIMRIPDSLLVSIIIGITNIIPFFGPFIGAIPALLLVVIQSPIHALYLLIFILILQQVDGNIIGPKILGNSTGLSSFWVMFSILVFGGMFGFAGMVFGVPVFGVIYYIVQQLVNYGLGKRGLPKETTKYIYLEAVNEESKEMSFLEYESPYSNEEKAKEPSKEEKKES